MLQQPEAYLARGCNRESEKFCFGWSRSPSEPTQEVNSCRSVHEFVFRHTARLWEWLSESCWRQPAAQDQLDQEHPKQGPPLTWDVLLPFPSRAVCAALVLRTETRGAVCGQQPLPVWLPAAQRLAALRLEGWTVG